MTGGCTGRQATATAARAQLLPFHIVREPLLAELRQIQTAVLVGKTSSGKTTQVPRLLLESGLSHGGSIACTSHGIWQPDGPCFAYQRP